jgi:hypothetical protein
MALTKPECHAGSETPAQHAAPARALPEWYSKSLEYHFEYDFWVFGRNGGIVRVTPSWRNPLLRYEAKHHETPLSQLD